MVIRINDLSLLWDMDNILHLFMGPLLHDRSFATVENDLHHHVQSIIHKQKVCRIYHNIFARSIISSTFHFDNFWLKAIIGVDKISSPERNRLKKTRLYRRKNSVLFG
jgi:hypothetical protein